MTMLQRYFLWSVSLLLILGDILASYLLFRQDIPILGLLLTGALVPIFGLYALSALAPRRCIACHKRLRRNVPAMERLRELYSRDMPRCSRCR